MISGTCLSAKSKSLTVIAAEPAGADDAYQSKANNDLIPQLSPHTIADGLRTSLGDLTWPFVRDQVDEVICADDRQIVEAMKFFWERTKQIIEPSAAVPLAVIMNSPSHPAFANKQVGVILSGGNIDLENLPW